MYHRRWTDKVLEVAVALIIIGIVMQVLIGYLVMLMPYIIGGLVLIGVGTYVVRRYRQW